MAVDHVKSTPITNLDASPAVYQTAGEGGPALLKSVSSGDVIGVASSSIDATYQFVRVPSNAKIKQVIFSSEAQAAVRRRPTSLECPRALRRSSAISRCGRRRASPPIPAAISISSAASPQR